MEKLVLQWCWRITNLNRIVISHININSIRNKFELLDEAVMGNVDILRVTETKIDESFPTSQFIIPVFTSTFFWFHATFSELLSKDKSVKIHQRNLQLLATEIFKTKNE